MMPTTFTRSCLSVSNAGASYQRLMDKVFNNLMGKCVEVYVNDVVVKSPSYLQHSKDLPEVFVALRKYKHRLNPKKL